MKIQIKRQTKRYLAEMLLIIISVLLAYSLNEYKLGLKEEKKLKTSIHFIKKEMEQNQAYLKEFMPIQQKIINNLDSLIKADKSDILFTDEQGFDYYNVYNDNFFQELLSNDAWQIANRNNILDKLEFKKLYALSKVYKQQKFVMEAVQQLSDLIQHKDNFERSKSEINCKVLRKRFHFVFGLEVRLQHNYKDALAILD